MAEPLIRYFPLGDSALTVEFGNEISEPLNKLAVGASRQIENIGFPGLIETVPAYASATVFYDPAAVRRHSPQFPTAFDAVRSIVESAVALIETTETEDPTPIEIPVDFGDEAGPDLAFVAEHNSLAVGDVISVFTSRVYRVYMLGFLPGFAYMGKIDAAIAAPRKLTPRFSVPKGSVGIAGRQTGIYSLSSPGGWQIVGRTDVELFTPNAEKPTFLNAGDLVRFVALK